MLDQRSDELAQSLLAPLGDSQRARLVAAMADVERLLTASMVEVAPSDPAHPHAQYCLNSYFAELDRRFDAGFDTGRSTPVPVEELRPPAGLLLVASLRGEPIGCGGLKLHGSEPAEIKRMWVAEPARGLAIGRRLLSELEARAADQGAPAARLETNKNLTEAISLYRSTGYHEIAPFNDEPYAHHWFEKALTGALAPGPFCGVDVDSELRVRREDGAPIDGLYAIGEVIGAGATSGNSFCGGMMVTPSLAFGRWLGKRLAQVSVSRVPSGPDR